MCLVEANQPVYPLDIVRQMRDQRAMLIQTAVSLLLDHISGNLSGREGGGTYRRGGYCTSDEGPESHVNSNSCKSATRSYLRERGWGYL